MNLYWIGARQYDIQNNKLFLGSVSRYGKDIDNNYSFCNNSFTKNYKEFMQKTLSDILIKDKDAYFMFANEKDAYLYGKNIFERTLCVNPIYISDVMNDKIFTRNFLAFRRL